MSRWTDKQVELLRDEVAKGPTAAAGIRRAAKRLKKSEGTVQQKWYTLAKKKPQARASRAKKASAHPRQYRKTPASGRVFSHGDLSTLGTDELVLLAKTVQKEVSRRRGELEGLSKLFS